MNKSPIPYIEQVDLVQGQRDVDTIFEGSPSIKFERKWWQILKLED